MTPGRSRRTMFSASLRSTYASVRMAPPHSVVVGAGDRQCEIARLGFVGPRITAVAIAAMLLIAACARGGPQAKATPSPSPLPSPSNVGWTSCGGGFQCATVQVPLDYAHPTNGDIGIALIKKPATNPGTRIGSLLTNPGGPGASGIQVLRRHAFTLAG